MSKISRTSSSRQNKFIHLMSNLITANLWLESEFLKRWKLFAFVFVAHCWTKKSQHLVSSNKQYAQYFVNNPSWSLTESSLNIDIRKPLIIEVIQLFISNSKMYPKLYINFKLLTSQLSQYYFLRNQISAPDVTKFAIVVFRCQLICYFRFVWDFYFSLQIFIIYILLCIIYLLDRIMIDWLENVLRRIGNYSAM